MLSHFWKRPVFNGTSVTSLSKCQTSRIFIDSATLTSTVGVRTVNRKLRHLTPDGAFYKTLIVRELIPLTKKKVRWNKGFWPFRTTSRTTPNRKTPRDKLRSPDNCQRGNCHPGKFPPENIPGQFPPRTIPFLARGSFLKGSCLGRDLSGGGRGSGYDFSSCFWVDKTACTFVFVGNVPENNFLRLSFDYGKHFGQNEKEILLYATCKLNMAHRLDVDRVAITGQLSQCKRITRQNRLMSF